MFLLISALLSSEVDEQVCSIQSNSLRRTFLKIEPFLSTSA
jgi:hypothetical protein